jgi:para-aminobenzoate synthetase/4-amino-4-deoxychorismate lyase
MTHNFRVLLREASSGEWLHFSQPHRIFCAARLDEVLPALREIERLVQENHWHAAGFLSYEAAPAFDPALAVRPAGGFPLLWFGLYPEPYRTKTLPPGDGDYQLGEWKPSVSRETYTAAIAQVKACIADGRTYQVNYTFRLRNKLTGSPWSLFLDMVRAQDAGYSAFIETDRHVIASASPELFFRLDGTTVTCRPMKGTVKRGRTLAEDNAQAAWLKASIKNRAENVMIVDMIRNDLGRLAKPGSVRVPELFITERYRTLWQMTTAVTAEIDAPFTELLTALFPCASITGAPKVSTMKIIAALETTPRGLYTGTIGYLAPGRRAQFSVAIRTLVLERTSGQAEYGIGGGIVWDSTSKDEYAEALLKARVLTERHPEFSLLETLRWTPGEGFFLLDEHLTRLADSAAYFNFPFDRARTETQLTEVAKTLAEAPQRIRLLLDREGNLMHQVFPLAETSTRPLRVRLAQEPVSTNDIFLYHKTTRREVYEAARQRQPDCDEVLLYNERGELTEGTIANLIVELDDELVTPPVTCGLLGGTLRAALLKQGQIREKVLTRADLMRCTQLFLVNSVRGWQPARLDEGA